jgi:hypothetical protein
MCFQFSMLNKILSSLRISFKWSNSHYGSSHLLLHLQATGLHTKRITVVNTDSKTSSTKPTPSRKQDFTVVHRCWRFQNDSQCENNITRFHKFMLAFLETKSSFIIRGGVSGRGPLDLSLCLSLSPCSPPPCRPFDGYSWLEV